jgi:hypothetical protein
LKKRNQFSSRSPSRVPYRTELIPRHGLCFRFWLRGHPRKAQRRIHGDAVRSGRRSSPRFSLLTVCVYYCSTYYKAVRAHSYPGFFRTPHLFQSSLVRFYQSPTPGCETVVGALNQGFPFSLLQCMQGRTRVAEAEPLRLPPSDSLGIPNGTVLNGNVTASGQLEALLHVAGGHPSAARRHASRTPA